MITVTKQTEQEQREMYSKMLKADVIDMLIESNKWWTNHALSDFK